MNTLDYLEHIDDMLTEYDDMSLYAFNIEMDFAEDVIRSITNAMNIPFDLIKLNTSLNSEQIIGAEKICVFFKENDTRQFVLLSCHQKCYVYEILVRCLQKDSNKIIPSFEPWRTDFFENVGGIERLPKDLYHEKEYRSLNGIIWHNDPVRSVFRFNGLIDG